MYKSLLQFLILSNLAFFNMFSMNEDSQESQKIKQISVGKNILLVDQTNKLKVWQEEDLLDNVVELIESPNKKFAIAIVVNKFENYNQTIVYIINYEETNNRKPFSTLQLGVEYGTYTKGSCELSDDGEHINIKTDEVKSASYLNSSSYIDKLTKIS